MRNENPTVDGMQNMLVGIKRDVNWSNDGTFKGFGGKGGGDRAFRMMKDLLPIEYKIEKALQKLLKK